MSMTTINHPGLDWHIFQELGQEARGKLFRIRDADPFLFSLESGNLAAHVTAAGKPRAIGTLRSRNGEIEVRSIPTLGREGHDRLCSVGPTIGAAAITARQIRRERATAMAEDALAIIGPRDQNKKIAVIETPANLAMTLATFSDYMARALPAGMKAEGMDRTSSGYFSFKVVFAEPRGVKVDVLRIRYANGRIETECLLDEKARVGFVDSLFEGMRARKDRVVNDPDLNLAIAHAIERAGTFMDVFRKDVSQAASMSHTFRFSSDSSLADALVSDKRIPGIYGSEAASEVPIGDGLSVFAVPNKPRAHVLAIGFKGEIIATTKGVMSGIQNPRDLHAAVRILAAQARPDIFAEDAKRLIQIDPTLPEPEADLWEAIRNPTQLSETPILDL